MPFTSATGIYNIQSVSFASAGSGNGFQNVQLQMSINNGANLDQSQRHHGNPDHGNNYNSQQYERSRLSVTLTLLVRLHFTNGQSNGNDLQN